MGHDLPSMATLCTKASRQKVGETEEKKKTTQSEGEGGGGCRGRNVAFGKHPITTAARFPAFFSLRYLSESSENTYLNVFVVDLMPRVDTTSERKRTSRFMNRSLPLYGFSSDNIVNTNEWFLPSIDSFDKNPLLSAGFHQFSSCF